MRWSSIWATLVGSCLLAGSALADPFVFSDTEFLNENWTDAKQWFAVNWDPANLPNHPNWSNLVGEHLGTGGVGDSAYRRWTGEQLNGQTADHLLAAHVFNEAYDPAVGGSLTELTFSYSLKGFNAIPGTSYRPLIEQGGRYYQGITSAVGTTPLDTWTPFSFTLKADDFVEITGNGVGGPPGSPLDFAAGPMKFGYATLVTVPEGQRARGFFSGLDNWSVGGDSEPADPDGPSDFLISWLSDPRSLLFDVTMYGFGSLLKVPLADGPVSGEFVATIAAEFVAAATKGFAIFAETALGDLVLSLPTGLFAGQLFGDLFPGYDPLGVLSDPTAFFNDPTVRGVLASQFMDPGAHFGLYSFTAAGVGELIGTGSASPVPEPSTWVLVVFGAAGIAWTRRRRKRGHAVAPPARWPSG